MQRRDGMNHAELMEEACKFFQSHLSAKGRNFLLSRYGLLDDTINQARIGFAPHDLNLLFTHLISKGYDIDVIHQSGLFYSDSQNTLWKSRIMFPYIEKGHVTYFIGRRIDDLKERKYLKQFACSQNNPHIIANESIFGIDTIRTGEVLVITEGITDSIICHQAGYSAIAPVTTRFKKNSQDELFSAIQTAGKVVVIMDNEKNGAGLNGAIDTGMILSSHGITCYIGTIPRAEGIEKVDLNDFIREGGNIEQLINESVLVDLHPLTKNKRKEQWRKDVDKMLSGMVRDHHRVSNKHSNTKWEKNCLTTEQKTDVVKMYIPSLSSFTGIDTGLGPHPIYGSSTGQNLSVNGDQWYCFHNGSKGGGGVFKWIAVYVLGLIKECEDLRGVDFAKTIQYCWDQYVPEDVKKESCEKLFFNNFRS